MPARLPPPVQKKTRFEDGYFDFIYVDARHDFKGVWEDLVAYWPKLRAGGIFAGAFPPPLARRFRFSAEIARLPLPLPLCRSRLRRAGGRPVQPELGECFSPFLRPRRAALALPDASQNARTSPDEQTINYDGTVDETGTVVKGAVDKFAASVCRQVTVSYREGNWNTWAVRK